jgi:putative oxidoreductase
MSALKTPNSIAQIARILLGLIYLFFGLNYFFNFLQAPLPDSSTKAGTFLGGLLRTGYFFIFLKTLETLYGLLLLADWFVPLVLILVFPISLNILLFHSFIARDPRLLTISSAIIGLNIFLAWTYRHLYLPLFNRSN